MFALDNNGSVKWQQNLYSRYGETSEEPAIDKNGNIIIGMDDTLHCFDYSGKLKWKKSITPNSITTSVIVDNSGNIYCGAWNQNNRVIAFNSEGNVIWQTDIEGEYGLYPPILNSDRKLIVPTFNSESIYILGN